MNQFKKILVGVNLTASDNKLSGVLSPPTEEAVERGLRLAEKSGAELCFATVLDAGDTAERLIHDAREEGVNIFDEAHALLNPLVERAKLRGVTAEVRVLMGKGWIKLIREVLKFHYDLVVIGTRHEGLMDRILFGSTAIKLLRKCPCPVWVAKPSEGRGLSSVLVAHDLRPVGRQALNLGVALARSYDLKLSVIHGVEHVSAADPAGIGIALPDADHLHKEARERIVMDLELAQDETKAPPQDRATVDITIVNGSPENAILKTIDENSVDLLIMGTIGRAGIRGVFTGNTAERLLPRLQCSLLAIKPDEFQCPIDAE